MMLAFDNLGSGVKIQLFDEAGALLDGVEIFPESQRPADKPDLLLEFSRLLQKHSAKPGDLKGIVFLNGPGRFTPVRAACVVANIFAGQLGTPLYPLRVEEYESFGSDFSAVIGNLPEPVQHVEAIFNAPPRITMPEAAPNTNN